MLDSSETIWRVLRHARPLDRRRSEPWGASPRSLLLVAVVTASLPLGCGGELDAQASSAKPSESVLRASFPEQAGRVIEQPEGFRTTERGFVPEAAGSWRGFEVELPSEGSEAIAFRLADGTEIRVREIGVEGPGERIEKAVAYHRTGGTSLWAATPGGVEEWLHLGAGAAVRGKAVAVWEIEGASAVQDGAAVALVDEHGATRLHATAPTAYAAGGEELTARLEAKGTRIELWVDADGKEVLVDPSWSTVTSMGTPRYGHVMVLMGNGKVLAAGGTNAAGTRVSTAEIYDPVLNNWTLAPPLAHPRHSARAILLPSGKVFVSGGGGIGGVSSTVDIYDTSTNQWAPGPSMSDYRQSHTITLISGKIFVTGGYGGGYHETTELYDPTTNSWTLKTAMSTPRNGHTATLLNNGTVIVTGGSSSDLTRLNTTERYSLASNTWTSAASMSAVRVGHTATLLPNGKVLVAGGYNGSSYVGAEVYDPSMNTWQPTQPMATPRSGHGAFPLQNGKVLIAGGASASSSSISSTEIYDWMTNAWTAGSSMSNARNSGSAVVFNNGNTLLSGGLSGAGTSIASVEQYNSLPLGSSCTIGAQCESNFCTDGVCCNLACTGTTCLACSAAKKGSGSNGTCGNIAASTDPDNECTDQGAASCGNNGSCSGSGSCQKYSNGTVCDATQCMGGTLVYADLCNGSGTCVDGGTQSCGDYVCAGTACLTSCSTDAQCAPIAFCSGAICTPKHGTGDPCSAANECSSGFCIDGVCCNSACDADPCQACSIAAGAQEDGLCGPGTGVACDDGDSCTQVDTCQAGICVGGDPIACEVPGACQLPGACDPQTGRCSFETAPGGTACDDGDLCTQWDNCIAGTCAGQLIACALVNACHEPATCDPTTGACTTTPKPDGTPCDDGGACAGGECEEHHPIRTASDPKATNLYSCAASAPPLAAQPRGFLALAGLVALAARRRRRAAGGGMRGKAERAAGGVDHDHSQEYELRDSENP